MIFLLIKHKTAKTTGDILGLTPNECFQQQESNNYEQDTEIGTVSYEFQNIDRKNRLISDNAGAFHLYLFVNAKKVTL
jgi:hypothetical protein